MIKAARRSIAFHSATLFLLLLATVGGLAVSTVWHGLHADARRVVNAGLAGQLSLSQPPPGVWIYQSRAGIVDATRGALERPLDPEALAAATGRGSPVVHEVAYQGREYLVGTGWRGDTLMQVVFDQTYQERQEGSLVVGVSVAAALGVVLSVLASALIARRAITPLAQAVARQRRFVADASHELRTPLTQLHTRAQLLARTVRGWAVNPARQDPGLVLADADQLVRGGRQLGDVVDDLLLAAQFGARPQQFGVVDLGVLASEVLAAEAHRAAEQQVTLRLIGDQSGPDGVLVGMGACAEAGAGTGAWFRDRYLVRGALSPLRRVLVSLVDNALGHTPRGGHVDIYLSVVDEGAWVQGEVRDDGVGLEPGQAERIFERFARGGHGGQGRRYGLGLALVREVVEGHRGVVDASGESGRGCTFRVRLPRWVTSVPELPEPMGDR